MICIPDAQFHAGFGQHKRKTLSFTKGVGLFRLTNVALTSAQLLVWLCREVNDKFNFSVLIQQINGIKDTALQSLEVKSKRRKIQTLKFYTR